MGPTGTASVPQRFLPNALPPPPAGDCPPRPLSELAPSAGIPAHVLSARSRDSSLGEPFRPGSGNPPLPIEPALAGLTKHSSGQTRSVRLLVRPSEPRAQERRGPFACRELPLRGPRRLLGLKREQPGRTSSGPSGPAEPGDIVLRYGTGWGETDPSFETGELATGTAQVRPEANPMVSFGGVSMDPSDVLYVCGRIQTSV